MEKLINFGEYMASNKIQILLVEDDEELGELIANYLRKAEFEVHVHNSGYGAEQLILDRQPDIVILDLMLPGQDGISICRQVRPFYSGSIVMLTASEDSVDHIIGLEIGADDFIQKPVEPRILLARIRTIVRRNSSSHSPSGSGQADNKLIWGNLEIIASDRQVRVQGQLIDLTTLEYDTLFLLAKNNGKILSRDELFRCLRNIQYDGQNRFIDILISQLRAKLAIDNISDKHIKTIRSKGYMFIESPN